MRYYKFLTILLVIIFLNNESYSQNVNVDINLNMKHSVDGVSDFGRERNMTIHATPHESDWNGHEDMLDYLINDLDVYFGRETGGPTWKMHFVEEDPNKPGWANETQMIEHGGGLKQWYNSSTFVSRHQYEAKSNMIMGINDHSPMYPNLSWYPGFGKGAGGWFVKDTDAAADWVAKYLAHYHAQSDQHIGEPLPKYWEVYNEPDMNFMDPSFGMIVSSLEKNWEYHKLVAQKVREKLGDKAPLIGGMTWGQLDLYKSDGLNRTDGQFWYDNSSAEANLLYDNMLSGIGTGVPNPGIGNAVWPKAWDNRGDAWWQWDFMYQGFIDYAGADMDFYGVHMYNWPNANYTQEKANTRAGGHIEAYLDMFEWYDNELFGDKKDIVLSEFGDANTSYILTLPNGVRDWPFLKTFNEMQMQFLERPSHVVYSMPFAPTKAIWGASFSGNNVIRYGGATLMEPRGSWTGDPDTWTMNEPTGGWGWSKIIYFFELWKGVDGTRIDTKSNDNDLQVDAYVLDDRAYLILNNTQDFSKTMSLNFHGENGNAVSNVEFRHLFKGDDNIPQLTVAQMAEAPNQVTLKPNSTIILEYTFDSNITIDETSQETKYMCEPLAGNAKNKRGTQLCHTSPQNNITATINGVVKPTSGEAIIRIGGFFANPTDGTLADGSKGIKVKKLTVNGNEVIVNADNFVANTRGYGVGSWRGSWFGVVELECPIEYLVNGQNTVYFERWQNAEFTTAMIQVFDMTTDPGRTDETTVALTSISLGSDAESLMNGNTIGLVPIFTPENASNRAITWSSSDTSVATVDENGVVTAIADSGVTVITATSVESSSIIATKTITTIPFEVSEVTSIEILEGDEITVDRFVNTPLTLQLNPTVSNAPEIEWTSSNESVASVLATGKVVGKIIGSTATITAKVKGTDISDQITVNVRIAGEESVFTRELPEFLRPFTTGKVNVPIKSMGVRTVLMELIKDDVVLGSGSQDVNILGDGTVEVTYNLSEAPTPDTDYMIRLTLKNGDTVLDVETKTIEIIDHIRVSSVTIASGVPTVKIGETITRTATAMPADAFNTNIIWTSSNTAIASVDETTGVITGIATGETTIRAASADVDTVFDEITITVQAEDVSIAIESITIPESINLFPGLSRTLSIELVPEFTTDTEINWSSNNSVATVDQNGLVTAGLADGTAIITATSTVDANVFATSTINVSKTIYIEAETFVNTGGASDGVIQSAVGFNNNTSGDWAEFTVYVPASGSYDIQFNVGSPNSTGLGVNTYVDGVLLNTTTLDGTGAWDTYVIQDGSGEISIDEGTHTIRFESTGPTEWQWNADWFSLTFLGTLSVGDTQIDDISVFPNPTKGNVIINGLNGDSTITIFTIQGRKVNQIKTSKENITINMDDYTNGMYLIRVMKNASGSANLYKIIKE
jgi:uncharacterized protein YjdB